MIQFHNMNNKNDLVYIKFYKFIDDKVYIRKIYFFSIMIHFKER